jgi:hypothetical protein
LESEIKQLHNKDNFPGSSVRKDAETSQEDILRETQDRYRRRKHLIVAGLPESPSGSIDDRKMYDNKKIIAIMSEIGLPDFKPKEIMRIGKFGSQRPRLLRIKCKNVETKMSILRLAKNLRKSADFPNIYINPDLTRTQREKDKILWTELKARRQAGETVIIRRGRITDINEKNFR